MNLDDKDWILIHRYVTGNATDEGSRKVESWMFLDSENILEPATEYIDLYQGTDWADPVFDESKHYLWPIPLNQLSHKLDLGHNPGWYSTNSMSMVEFEMDVSESYNMLDSARSSPSPSSLASETFQDSPPVNGFLKVQ